MPLILSGNVASATADADVVTNSCRFDGTSAYMGLTLGTPTNNKIYTFSAWVKRSKLGQYGCMLNAGSSRDCFRFRGDNDHLHFFTGDATTGGLETNRVFRDPSAWYHLVCAVDTTQATDTNRVKLYVNGVQETSFTNSDYPAQDYTNVINSAVENRIGKASNIYDEYFGGYMAEAVFIDGQQLTPTSFGEYDEDSPTIWKPIDVSGLTFGDNGFYLDFEASDNLGNDANGGSDFSETNLAAADQATDTPTNNYCTLNPLEAVTAATTYAQGNTQGTTSNAARATFAVTNGKWYWEHKAVNKEAMGGVMAYDGFAPNDYTINALISCHGPNLVLNGSEESGWADGTPDALVDNDILQVALDCDNNRIAFGVNGAWYNATDGSGEWSGTTLNYFSISDGYYYSPAFRTGSGSNRESHFNFGGCPGFAITSSNADANGYGNFEFTVPSGFYALCTKNLAEYG